MLLDFNDCNDSGLLKHAKRELAAIDALEDWPIYRDIIAVFSSQGHSGGSASCVIPTLNKLLNYQPLSPITSSPEEWMEVDEGKMWQNKRKGTSFSVDAGKTWYDIEDPEKKNWPESKN